MYSGSNDRNLLVWTPDHAVEARYMEDMELQNTQPKASGRIAEMSVLADTWSDDDD